MGLGFARMNQPGYVIRLVPGPNPSDTTLAEVYVPPEGAWSPRGIDMDLNGVVWVPLASGHIASFDRRKCKGPLNGPGAASAKLRPEGWTLYRMPAPPFKALHPARCANDHAPGFPGVFLLRVAPAGLAPGVPAQGGFAMNAKKPVRSSAALAALAFGALAFAAAPARAQSGDPLETIHHPNYDKSVFMPFAPAIKIKSGRILWLAGGTALPVYHDHPHKREQILKYLTNDLEAQVRQTMDGIMETLKAAGASPKDVVHVFIFRARPRMGDIGKASAVVNSYFAPHNHKPTTTNLPVLELGEPEQLVEIQVVAVVD